MDEIEFDILSFIARVWVENRAEKAGRGIWCGQITHVDIDYTRRF